MPNRHCSGHGLDISFQLFSVHHVGSGCPGRAAELGRRRLIMVLSLENAASIVEAVAAEAKCWKSIEPYADNWYINVVAVQNKVLEHVQLAGAVRNVFLLPFDVEDPKVSKLLCVGIACETVVAIHAAMKTGRLPNIASCSSIHRVFKGTHHDATWVRMKDDREYVFDWHATLKVRDPAISKAADWMEGRWGVRYASFSGFGD